MSVRTRATTALTAALATAVLGGALVTAAPAQARPIDVTLPLTGGTTLAKTGDVLTLPEGSRLDGALELSDGKLTGRLTVPTITAHLKVAGLFPVVAQVKLVPQQKAVATIKKNLDVVFRDRLRIKIPFAALDVPGFDGINIVQDTCRTEPFTLRMDSTNKFNLERKLALEGTYTIPAFGECNLSPVLGIKDGLLTAVISGEGNTIAVKAGPTEAA